MFLHTMRQIQEAEVNDLHGGNPNLIEFPDDNFVASLQAKEKRVELSPRDDSKTCTAIRALVKGLRDKFKVANVVQVGMNTFDVTMDPAEDFNNVAAYVKNYR